MYLRKESIYYNIDLKAKASTYTVVTPWGNYLASTWGADSHTFTQTRQFTQTRHNIYKILGIEAIDVGEPDEGVRFPDTFVRKEANRSFPWHSDQELTCWEACYNAPQRVIILTDLFAVQNPKWGPRLIKLKPHTYEIEESFITSALQEDSKVSRDWYDRKTGLWNDTQYEYLALEIYEKHLV